jgi:hypothetical protein
MCNNIRSEAEAVLSNKLNKSDICRSARLSVASMMDWTGALKD